MRSATSSLAILIAVSSSPTAVAQTASFLDRSSLAQQTQVDSSTGEVLQVPQAYIRVHAADRSDLARRTQIDDATGEIKSVPEAYESPGAPDRAHLAQQTAVDDSGRVTDVPQLYADVKGIDRGQLAQQLVIDVDTGGISAVPEIYADVRGGNRSLLASSTQIDLATGEVKEVPGIYPSDFDADALPDPSDNCPFFHNPDQADTNADGRGNDCECGDQSLNGSVTVSDLVAISIAIFDPALVTALCDGNNDSLCNVSDIVAANRTIFVPKSSVCERQPVPGP